MRYEYLHVTSRENKLWVIRPDETMAAHDLSSSSFVSVMNELGREGWEMVSATSIPLSQVGGATMWTSHHWWFKRSV